MRVDLLLFLVAALNLAIATTGIPTQAGDPSAKCHTLKCILSFPDVHSLPSEDIAALSPSSLVDVLLHFSDHQIISGRSAAERIAGTSIDHFIAPSSFAATVSASSLSALAAEPLIRSVTRLLPEHKFSLSELRRYFSGEKPPPRNSGVGLPPTSLLSSNLSPPVHTLAFHSFHYTHTLAVQESAAPSSPSTITDAPPPPPQHSTANPDYRPHATIIVLTHTNSATAVASALTRTLTHLSSTETCKVAVVSNNKIALTFTHASFEFVSRAAAAAATLPSTLHVHPRADVHLMNFYATGNIQSGTMNPVAGASPLWDAGACHCESSSAATHADSVFLNIRAEWKRRGGGLWRHRTRRRLLFLLGLLSAHRIQQVVHVVSSHRTVLHRHL
jgi:hypothetical protein